MKTQAPSRPAGTRRALSIRALWVVVPVLQLGYQIAAKHIGSALPDDGSLWRAISTVATTPWLALLLVCELMSLFIWMFVLSEIKLSAAFPMTAAGYVLVILAGWFVFQEPIDALSAAGSSTILFGVWLIGHEEAKS